MSVLVELRYFSVKIRQNTDRKFVKNDKVFLIIVSFVKTL